MHLDITKTGSGFTIELVEPSDFKRFHVSATGLSDVEVQQALADADAGSMASTVDHCWVDILFLVERARPASVSEVWQQDFDKLLEFAAGRGWVDENGTMLLGHIVRS